MNVHRAAASAALVVLLLAGCQSGSPVPATATPAKPDDMTRELPAEASIQIRGDITVDWDGSDTLTLIRAGEPGGGVNLVSIGFLVPVRLPSGYDRVRWSFDLMDEYTDRPGGYVLDPARARVPGVESNVHIVHVRASEAGKDRPYLYEEAEVDFVHDYSTIKRPCDVQLGANLLSGSLSCSALADERGREISVYVTWRVIDEQGTGQALGPSARADDMGVNPGTAVLGRAGGRRRP